VPEHIVSATACPSERRQVTDRVLLPPPHVSEHEPNDPSENAYVYDIVVVVVVVGAGDGTKPASLVLYANKSPLSSEIGQHSDPSVMQFKSGLIRVVSHVAFKPMTTFLGATSTFMTAPSSPIFMSTHLPLSAVALLGVPANGVVHAPSAKNVTSTAGVCGPSALLVQSCVLHD